MFGYGKMAAATVINQANLLENGKWQYFHPNGELESKGKFISGKKEGSWIFYDKRGIKRMAIRFKKGSIISQKEY